MATQLSPENLDKAFALLEGYAARGERCPISTGPSAHSFLKPAHFGKLAREGRIFVEISGRNWRRITILIGPHKGKSTMPNPEPMPTWQTIGRDGQRINGKRTDYGASSRPQPWTPPKF